MTDQRLRAPDGRTDYWLTPGEVARVFNVNPRTVTRWAKDGLIPHTTTLGGHRRYLLSDIRRLLTEQARTGKR